MRRFLSLLVVGFLFISLDTYAGSVSTEELVLLNSEGLNVLNQVSQLRQEVVDLQANLDAMDAEIERTENSLKKVSAASVTARRQTKFLKKTKPEYEALRGQLLQKKTELKNREASLTIIESKMSWLEQDGTSGELIETVSRFVVP